jgi:DNA helicase-2/ATP-dependent DNA helicase PcrA
LPSGVNAIFAENQAVGQRRRYSIGSGEAKPIYSLIEKTSLLVLTMQNDTVSALRAFFNRRLPIWEGHVRQNLTALIDELKTHNGNATGVAQAVVNFLAEVTTGFSPSAFGNPLMDEVSAGCVAKRRGKPATLQALGRMILDQPNHKGVAKLLRRLTELRETESAFQDVKLDYSREFWDAVWIGQFEDPDEGFAEISRRRSCARLSPPAKAISTVHKAKGLECSDVLLMPCDASHFGDTPAARCCLYVAMSRAMRSLTFVLSRQNPSPLFAL